MRLTEKFTVITLLGVFVVVGISSFTRRPALDPAIAQLKLESAGLRSVIHAREAEIAMIVQTRDSLRMIATRTGERYASASQQLRSHFAIDSIVASHVPKPAVTLAASSDTTQMYDLIRLTDSTRFPIPLEFLVNLRKDLVASDSAYHAERLLRVYQEDFLIPQKDTLIGQLHQLAEYNAREAALWQKKANPRCGRRCSATLGAVGALAVVYVAHRYGP